MSAEDRTLLDEIEGLGSGYDGIELDMPEYGTCFSYIAQHAYLDDTLQPYDWYKAFVLAGARFHRFPRAYLEHIETTLAILDPDPKRGAGQWDSVKKVITAHC